MGSFSKGEGPKGDFTYLNDTKKLVLLSEFNFLFGVNFNMKSNIYCVLMTLKLRKMSYFFLTKDGFMLLLRVPTSLEVAKRLYML